MSSAEVLRCLNNFCSPGNYHVVVLLQCWVLFPPTFGKLWPTGFIDTRGWWKTYGWSIILILKKQRKTQKPMKSAGWLQFHKHKIHSIGKHMVCFAVSWLASRGTYCEKHKNINVNTIYF